MLIVKASTSREWQPHRLSNKLNLAGGGSSRLVETAAEDRLSTPKIVDVIDVSSAAALVYRLWASVLPSFLLKDLGSVLKQQLCQQQLVDELGSLVAKFALNLSGKGATPIQRGFRSRLLGRIWAVKLVRHTASRATTTAVRRLLRAPGSKL
jgi:hypothetical protein